MKFSFEGREWKLDTGHMSFRHALAIQEFTGMSIADWQDSLDFKQDSQGNVLNPGPEWVTSIAALYWLVMQQNGVDPGGFDELDFDFQGFFTAFMTASIAELERTLEEAKARQAAAPKSPRSPRGGPASPARSTRKATTRTPRALPQVVEGAIES